MKKVLFIDRDGTLAKEPEDEQLDAFEKLEFLPGVFTSLGKIARELNYELVMVTNQDGLGTASFPEETFWPVQHFIMNSFRNEGVKFNNVFIDRSFPEQNLPTRKPGTALLSSYIDGNYDLKNSFVIGDRLTDIELAFNLGAQGILINYFPEAHSGKTTQHDKAVESNIRLKAENWQEIYDFLSKEERKASIVRHTSETDINIELNLEGQGVSEIQTGLHFFDHMLDQLSRHGGLDLKISCIGDLEVDEHHTIEDVGLALGEAFRVAIGKKIGMERYGFQLPMDDCLASVSLDFSGRPWLVWEVRFLREFIGDVPTEMFYHFFKSFSDKSGCNINISAEGQNEHHKIEAVFKAFARAIKMAVKKDFQSDQLPSTKGTL